MNTPNTKLIIGFIGLGALAFSSCKKDSQPKPAMPVIEHVEVGLGDNGIGVVGEDFHLEMDVVAGERIDVVQVRIEQRAGETYARQWHHEITWEQYRGARNTNVHRHFDIPEDAPEGTYDFVIVVQDQNGARLEEKRTLRIYLRENLPVDPTLTIFNIHNNNEIFYRNGEFAGADVFRGGDIIRSQVTIGGLKGDGAMYILLIDKQLNHRPETVDGIDFSKAIVYDVYQHEGWETVGDFSNFVFDLETFTTVRALPRFTIGADQDNNSPQPNPISGDKTWKSGDYLFGVVYTNTTHNMSFYHYIDLKVALN